MIKDIRKELEYLMDIVKKTKIEGVRDSVEKANQLPGQLIGNRNERKLQRHVFGAQAQACEDIKRDLSAVTTTFNETWKEIGS